MDSKKIILVLFFFIFVLMPISAQIEKSITKKHLLVGGSFGFNMNNSTITNKEGHSYSPEIKTINSDLYCGYFILNQFAIGIKPDFEIRWFSWITDDVEKTFNLTINSFLRYYFKFGLFGEGTIGMGTSRSAANSELWRKREILSWSVSVGYSLFVTDRIAIEPILSYKSRQETEMLDDKDIESWNGLYFSIGFQIYLKTGKN